MSVLLRRIRSSARVARRDPQLASIVVRAYVLMVVARGVITILPLRRITRHLGEPMHETPRDGVSDAAMRYARRVGWAIDRIAPYTPTTSNCYPQAMAANWLLRRKRIPQTFYYGAAFRPDGKELAAHAWVRCGPTVITGSPAHLRFAVLATYAWVPRGADVATTPVEISASGGGG